MPIRKPGGQTEPIIYPNSNYRIVKYLDLIKLISLLQRGSIFFCRLDNLEDHFEGITSFGNYETRKQHYRKNYSKMFGGEYTEENIKKLVDGHYNWEKQQKAVNCISCWNKSESESAALWKIYSDFKKGIMISSSISRIEKAFHNTPEKILLSEVKYIDLNKDIMPDWNTIYPLIHKHQAYSFEEEIRLIHEVDYKTSREIEGPIYDWSKEELKTGKYLKVDLDILIEEIVISPYSPDWYIDLIQDLVDKYGLNRKVKKSELSKNGI